MGLSALFTAIVEIVAIILTGILAILLTLGCGIGLIAMIGFIIYKVINHD